MTRLIHEPPVRSLPSSAPSRVITVLVVDDHEQDRQKLAKSLLAAFPGGIEIREAEEGARAMELLERVSFDMVLMEARLPDIDGLELLSQIAEFADHVPVIVMTSQGNDRLAAQAIKMGAADYLLKQDIKPASIKRAVTQSLRTAKIERRNLEAVRQLRRHNSEMDHFVKALSHDMSVNFMLLEHSLKELKKNVGESPLKNLTDGFAHVESGLKESRRFLDDLVKLSQTGSVHMEPQRVELTRVIQEVVFEQEELLKSRGIEVDAAADLPAVWCNESRVKQVFTNLIRNAAKHGCDMDRPRIEIRLLSTPAEMQAGGRAEFCFSDNGPGIPKEWQKEVFLPGRRVPGTASSGTGMGLAIVRRVIEQYGGTIELVPDLLGANFVFSLPLPE